jgi:uncharacterized protein (DUF1697 family)
MPRYVAFLRGVSPVNAKMADLKRCFESAGFQEVRTVLSSGNVVFSSRAASESTLARKAENAMQAILGRKFATIVKSTSFLQELLEADHHSNFDLPKNAKRVVTFLHATAQTSAALPAEKDGAIILGRVGTEVFTAYVPNARGPVFMALLEKAFGSNITTRTLDTIRKCARA